MLKGIERIENSLCFDNLDMFLKSVERVRDFLSQSEILYLDGRFPSRNNPIPEHLVIRNDKSSFFGGRVYPAEAVAALYLQAECAGLYQWTDNTFGLSETEKEELRNKVWGRLKLDHGNEWMWLGAVEEGISDFGEFLCLAAAIRKLILRGKTPLSGFPENELPVFHVFLDPVEKFFKVLEGPIRKDEMVLERNVAEAIVAIVFRIQTNKAIAKYQEFGGKQGVESTVDLMARSARHGGELAKALYLEVLKMAKGIFSIEVNSPKQALRQFFLLEGASF